MYACQVTLGPKLSRVFFRQSVSAPLEHTAVHVPRARSSSIRRACSRRVRVASVCCKVHCANTSIFPALAQVLEYLAPAPAADAAPIVTATGGFGSLPVCPPSAPPPVVEYIASTLAVYAAPYLSLSRSRCTSSVVTPAPAVSQRASLAVYASPAPVVEYIAPDK